jgi:hypothetical protein
LTGHVSFVATRSWVATRSNQHLNLWANAHTAAFGAVVTTMYRLISLAVVIVWVAMFVPSRLYARDDGRFTNSPLKEWFDRLASKNGLCCAFADGVGVQDVDWDSQEGHYRVRIYGQWFVVPDAAVVTEPNRFGPAVVWPYTDRFGITRIRCFIPGAGT